MDNRRADAAISDLAAATATVLASPRYKGEVLELTGPDELDWNDLSATAGVPFRAVSDETYSSYLTENFGLRPDAATALIALYADFREGWSARTGTLADLLGRPPVPCIQAVEARVALFPAP